MNDPQKERKKVSTTVYLTLEQVQALKLLNQKTKVPIAEFIREGINLVLERYKDHLPGQILLLPEEVPTTPAPRLGMIRVQPSNDNALDV